MSENLVLGRGAGEGVNRLRKKNKESEYETKEPKAGISESPPC